MIIRLHIWPSTIPPIRFGIKNTVLKALVPRSPLVISSATAKAMTLTVITETKVNLTVSHREFRKVSSLVKMRI